MKTLHLLDGIFHLVAGLAGAADALISRSFDLHTVVYLALIGIGVVTISKLRKGAI